MIRTGYSYKRRCPPSKLTFILYLPSPHIRSLVMLKVLLLMRLLLAKHILEHVSELGVGEQSVEA